MNPNKSPFGSYDEAPEDNTDEPPKREETQAPPPKPFSLDFGSKAPDFLSRIMGKENGPDDDEESEKNDNKQEEPSFFSQETPEEPPAEAPKTWHNLISGTLPKVEQPKEQPVVAKTEQSPKELTSPENEANQSQIDQTDNIPPEPVAEVANQPLKDVEQPPIIEQPNEAEDKAILATPVASAAAPKTSNKPSSSQPNIPPPIPNTQNTYTTPPTPNVVATGQTTGNVLPPSPNISPQGYNQLPNNPPVTTERIIERKPVGAVLAFVGAEVLSRRRDKKLGEKIKKEAKTRKQTLEELQNHQKNQLNELERKREIDASRQRRINEEDANKAENSPVLSHEFADKPTLVPEVPPPVIYEGSSASYYNQNSSVNNEFIDQSTVHASETPKEVPVLLSSDKPATRASEVLQSRYGKSNPEISQPSGYTTEAESRQSFEYAQRYDSAEFDPRARRTNVKRAGDSKVVDQSPASPSLPMVYTATTQNPTQPQPLPSTQPKSTDPPYKKPIQYGIGAALLILTLAIVAAYLTN